MRVTFSQSAVLCDDAFFWPYFTKRGLFLNIDCERKLLGLLSLAFTSDARALYQVKMNATQAQENEIFLSLSLFLCLRRGRFHNEISLLVLVSLVKSRL